ncbi:MAG: exodeoxyribonuclease III [Myxococcales bacterium]
MKIASWNVNSIRSRLPRLLEYLATAQPDALCLQELKCTDEAFPKAEIEAAGYRAAFVGQPTYNGVAILARDEPQDVQRGLQDGVEDPQARLIAATVGGVRVVSIYGPNGQGVGSAAYTYKLEWYWRLKRFLEIHRPASGLVAICGDYNVAPEDRDVYSPKLWEGRTMTTPAERERFAALLELGLVDSFRIHHAGTALYSWWDYRAGCFARNFGLRIDHVLLSRDLAARCTAAGIDRDLRKGKAPSDHAPVWAECSLAPS